MLDKILGKALEGRLPPFLKDTSGEELSFKSQNGLKTLSFQIWFFLGLIIAFLILIDPQPKTALKDLLQPVFDVIFSNHWTSIPNHENKTRNLVDSIMGSIFFLLPILFFFIVWLFAKPDLATFNRAQQTVHFKTSAHNLLLPFTQIKFLTQWFPTKAGGSTEFFVTATGPFGPGFFHRSPKKNRKFNNQSTTLNLGTFRVEDEAEGERYQAFFQAYMAGQGSALDLYQSIVDPHSQTKSPFAKPSWKDFV